MGIILGGNNLIGNNFNTLGEVPTTPNVVTDGLVLWLDAGMLDSFINTSTNYYDCGYGMQYYASNPGCTPSSSRWVDISGHGSDGTLNNTPTFTGVNGGGVLFNGANHSVDVTKDFGTLSNYTICFWARRDAEDRMPIAGRTSTAYYWYGDNSWFYTHGGVSGEYYYSKPTSIPLGTYGHYCVVYNGSNVTIYRQGIYQGQQSTSGTANWSQGIKIGYWSAGGGYAYQGIISVVHFYNIALTQSQVQENFNNGRQRFGI